MELNISRFFKEAASTDYSASVAEIGRNAGPDTWRAACDDSGDYMMLDDEDKREAFRKHVREFGAWSDDEIAAWSDVELNALLIQMIAGDIREAGLDQLDPDWDEYEAGCREGIYSFRLFVGDDGEVYYYIGT